MTITVTPVNDAPVAVADTATTAEDTPVTTASVLANDTDIDGDTLSISAADAVSVNGGTVVNNLDGTFTYTPAADFNGGDSFTYTVADGNGGSATGTVTVTVTPVNDAPVAVADSYAVGQGQTLNVAAPGLLANDTDIEADALIVVATPVIAPAHGALTLNADGSFTYIHDGSAIPSDSFTYQISDGNGGTAQAAVTITLAGNISPTAVADSYTVAEDGVLTVAAVSGVLANDTDPESDPLTAALVTSTTNGSLTLNADGSFTYTPNANYNGTDSFTYQAADPFNSSNTATVTITVTPVNDPPVAVNDTATTAEDTPVTTASVLLNDLDLDGDTLSVSAADAVSASGGTVVNNLDGTFTYTPAANFNGIDSFTYTVTDGNGGSATGTVTVTVTPVNDAPVAVADTATTAEDTPLTTGNVLANDTDVEGDTLSVSAADAVSANGGTVVNNLDGTFTYTPAANYNGTDSFTYTVADGNGGSAAGTVTITVTPANDAPNAVADSYTAGQGQTLNVAAPGMLANDTDVDGDTLTVNTVPVAAPVNGTLTLYANGSFSYTHDGGAATSDTFTCEVSDGNGGTAQAVVTITIAANLPPTAVADSYAVAEDGVLTVTAGTGVLANDTDPESDPLTAALVATTANGILALNADGSFTYTPNADYNGTDSFTYTAADAFSSSNTATVTITVTPVNDPPVAVNDAAVTAEDTPVTTVNVLANDTDVDGDTLSVSASDTASVNGGTVVNNPDGTFTYTPAADFNGDDSFTYTVADGNGGTATGTVTITVTPVNDAPNAVADGYATGQGQTLTVTAPGVLGNDTDVEGDTLTVNTTPVVAQLHGSLTLFADGSFTYIHDGGVATSDSFTYEVSDGNGGTAQAVVTITIAANGVPTAVADSYTVAEDGVLTVAAGTGVLSNDTDPESDPLTATLVSTTSNGSLTLNADGSFTYTPNTNYNGSDSFTYQAADAYNSSNVVTVTITVTPVNDAPVAVNDAAVTAEDSPVTTGNVLANDTDIDGDTLSVSAADAVSANGGTVVNNLNGTFTYTPAANYNGGDSFTYTVSDGNGGSATGTVTVTVTPVNDAPVAVADTATTAEDTPVTTGNVLANDTDVDGDTLSVSAADAVSANGGTVVNNLDGTFTYTPALNYDGGDSFSYTVADGNGGSATGTVTITVTPVNDAPAAVADSYSVTQGGTRSVAAPGVLNNDTDTEGDPMTAVLVTGPANALSFALNADGSFSYTHDGGASSSDSFTYKANDGLLDSNVVTVTITVNANGAPTAVADSYTVAEDGVLTVAAGTGVLSNDTDPESDPLSAALVTTTTNGILTLFTDGSFTYTPNANFNGSDSFTYTAADPYNSSNAATVTITVTPVNDPPVAVADTATTAEDTPVTTGNVLANDTDVDGDTLSVSTADAVSANGGTVVNNLNGTFTYTPAANYNGGDSFSYTVADGNGGTAAGTVTITVTPVNDPPVAVADTATTAEDTPVTTGNVLANDTDVDGDTLSVSAADAVSANGGTVVNNLDGTFTYTPAANYNGGDSFSYTVADGNGGTAAGTVTVTVTPVNDPPVAVADGPFAVVQGQTLTVNAPGILANDSDIEGNTLTVNTTPVVAPTSASSFTLNANGSFSYTHNGGAPGSDSFTYQISDGNGGTAQATVAITVTAPPDAVVSGKANWTPGSSGGSLDITENFTGSADAAAAVFAQGWTTGTSGTQTTCWYTDQNTTASGATGLTAGNPQPYVYLEASTGGTPTCGAYSAGDSWWMESPNIDAALYTTLNLSFDWNYESNTGVNSRSIAVYYRNGTGGTWTLLQNIASGPLNNPSGPWASTGNINLASVLNQTGSRVRIQVTTTDTAYQNDIAFDNIRLVGTGAPAPATLDVLAANSSGTTGGNVVHADYNGNTYNLTNVGGNRWSFSGTDLANVYVNSIRIWSDQDTTGKTYPVSNNGPALAWPTIAVTGATWDGVSSVNVTATSSWNSQDQLFVDYDGSGPVAMTWNTDHWQHSFTGYPAFVAGNATVTGNAAANSPQAMAVVDSTANLPPAFGQSSYTMANATAGAAYNASISGYATDPESNPITYSKDGGTCTWANVAANGAVTGTPSATGACTVLVRATATGGFATATLNITVNAAAVSVLNAWPTTPQLTGTTGNMSGTFTIGAGSNRLLLVAVSCYDSAGSAGQTFSATYGGRPLTQAFIENTNRRSTWIGYLRETDISSRTGDSVAVTVTGTHSGVSAFIGSYANVNQTTPIAASGGSYINNTNNVAVNAATLSVGAGGYAVYNWSGTSGVTRTSDNETYIEHADVTSGGVNVGVASKSFPSAGNTNPTVTWSANIRSSVSLIVLNRP
ncbi:MAG: Ig-like domain-containing protein [Thermodesulfobacteriota bacterium]